MSIKLKAHLHASTKFWPTSRNEPLTVTHNIRKLARCTCKDLHLQYKPLVAQTSPKGDGQDQGKDGSGAVPGSPSAGKARRERAWRAHPRPRRALRTTLSTAGQGCHREGAVGWLPLSWRLCNLSTSSVENRGLVACTAAWTVRVGRPNHPPVPCAALLEVRDTLPINLSFGFSDDLRFNNGGHSMLDRCQILPGKHQPV